MKVQVKIKNVNCRKPQRTNLSTKNWKKKLSILRTKKKKRKYQEQYIQFRFTFIEEKSKHRPKCVICLDIFASESMKPSKP